MYLNGIDNFLYSLYAISLIIYVTRKLVEIKCPKQIKKNTRLANVGAMI